MMAPGSLGVAFANGGRMQVSPVVRELGRFTCEADVDCIAQVLQRWQQLLQFDLFEVGTLTGCAS